VDGLLVYAHGIVIVCVPNQYSIIIGIVIFLIRMLTSYYIPFYEGSIKRLHTFLQGTGIIILTGLDVCKIQDQIIMFVVIALVLTAGLHHIVFKTSNMDYWRVT
jgi:hypothetical protein